jgi:hypothetical protein
MYDQPTKRAYIVRLYLDSHGIGKIEFSPVSWLSSFVHICMYDGKGLICGACFLLYEKPSEEGIVEGLV